MTNSKKNLLVTKCKLCQAPMIELKNYARSGWTYCSEIDSEVIEDDSDFQRHYLLYFLNEDPETYSRYRFLRGKDIISISYSYKTYKLSYQSGETLVIPSISFKSVPLDHTIFEFVENLLIIS